MRTPESLWSAKIAHFAGTPVYVHRLWYGRWQALTDEGNSRTAWRRSTAIEKLRRQYEEIWQQGPCLC